MRTREILSNPITSNFTAEKNINGGGWVPDPEWAEAGHIISDVSSVMRDTVTPNFRKRSAAGEIIINPMYRFKITKSGGGGFWHVTNGGNQYRNTGDGSITQRQGGSYTTAINAFPLPPNDDQILLAQAKQNALAKIDHTQYRFMEDLIEFRRSLELLRNPLRFSANVLSQFHTKGARVSTRRLGRDFKAGDRHRLTYGLTGGMARAWLQLNFGFGNVFRTAVYTYEILDRLALAKPTRRRAFSELGSNPQTGGRYNSSNSKGQAVGFDCTVSKTITCKAGILYEVTNPIRGFTDYAGLRAKDIPRGVYDVLPYSWVVSRFVDLGKTIDGLMNLSDPNVHLLGAYTKTHSHLDTRCTFASWMNGTIPVTIAGDTLRYTEEKVVRNVWTPTVEDTLPVFSLKQDLRSTSDLIALCLRGLRS